MTASPLRWTVIPCSSPYACRAQFVADLNLEFTRPSRVPIIDRAMAAKGWATVGVHPYCPACFERVTNDQFVHRTLAIQVQDAHRIMPVLRQIEVG